MADATDSKSVVRKDVRVQVPPPVPHGIHPLCSNNMTHWHIPEWAVLFPIWERRAFLIEAEPRIIL